MKKILSCLCFCLIIISLLSPINEILISKTHNRYYILEKYLEEIGTEFDVQVYGSCHAYTSFNPNCLKENTGMESFVFANPGEIMPSTYLRMREQFKEHVPQVAVVEIWGINPYETYDSTEKIFGSYFQTNIQQIPFSLEKLEVIDDFETLDMLEMAFPISKYKDRLLDNSLRDFDFNYSFDIAMEDSSEAIEVEMSSRLENNGFKVNPSVPVEQYEDLQKLCIRG